MVQGGRLPGHRGRLRRSDLVRHGHEHGVVDHHRQLSGRAPSDWIEFNAQEFSSSAGSGTTWGSITPAPSPTPRRRPKPSRVSAHRAAGSCTSAMRTLSGVTPRSARPRASPMASPQGPTWWLMTPASRRPVPTNRPRRFPAEVSLALATAFTASGSGGGGGAATISAVGSLASNAAIGLSTLSVSPQHVGDMLALTTLTWSGSVYPTSISGGGVTTWSKAVDYPVTADGYDAQIWYGTVTTTGRRPSP